MNLINGILTRCFDWILAPLANWPLVALFVSATVVGLLMSLVFKYTSDQAALSTVLDRSRGNVLAIKLFKDDIAGMFRSLANVFWYVGLRIWYSLFPVMIMIVPLFFILAQLFLRYEYRPLRVGEQAVVELQLDKNAWKQFQRINLAAGSKIGIETAALRDDELHSVYWRIRAGQPGFSLLRWNFGSNMVEKSVVVSDDESSLQKVNQRRPGSDLFDRSWFAGEPAIKKLSPAKAAIVYYPRRETPLLGFPIPWWVTFFVVSILAALLAQPVLKVRF